MAYQFTLYPNPEFNFNLLPQFSSEHGVSYHINKGNTITFSSNNLDTLDEVSDQLSFLTQTPIS